MEQPAPWWSWAPRFPKPAIIAAALIYDLIVVGTILNNLSSSPVLPEPLLLQILNAAITPSITANAIALAMFIQLNGDVIYMILTMKANYEEKREAIAKAKAEAKAVAAAAEAEAVAEAEARIKAEVMAWYHAHKDNLQAAPPPFSENGNGRPTRDSQ